MAINWKTAPEDAMYYSPACGGFYISKDKSSYFYKGEWVRFTSPGDSFDYYSKQRGFTQRPGHDDLVVEGVTQEPPKKKIGWW